MVLTLDLGELFNKTWGYKPQAFELDPVPARKEFADLGSPYYGIDANGREYYMPVELGGYELPHPVIKINSRKNIVETELTEFDGTVKELINNGDWSIVIRGFIISEDKEYPEQVINDLMELYLRKEALEIRSAITDIYLVTPDRQGFDRAVIYSCDFPDAPGVQNVRAYEFVLKSDKPFDAYID